MITKKLAIFEIDDKKIDLIKKTVAVGATDDELKLFLYHARRTGLDPLARQIYFIKRNVKKVDGTWESKATIQASIDGLRVVAERSGSYAGQDKPEYEEVGMGLKSCTVTVYRFNKGVRYPAGVGVAYWSEYAPDMTSKQSFMWKKMPHTMLSKCAEALALRKAFPQDLSGLYTQEGMDQSEPVEEISEVPEPPKTIEETIPPETPPEVTVKSGQTVGIGTTPPPQGSVSLKQLTLINDLFLKKHLPEEEVTRIINEAQHMSKEGASILIKKLLKG